MTITEVKAHSLEYGRVEESTKWVALTKTRYPEESLGFILFPDELENRFRSEAVLNKKIDVSVLPSLVSKKKTGVKSIIFNRFAENKITTVDDILNLQETNSDPNETDLSAITGSIGHQKKIKDDLKHYLERLIITPHGRLIEALCQQIQYPVPSKREQELIKAVEEKVNALYKRDSDFLIYRFGLQDGIFKSFEEITSRHDGHHAKVIEGKLLQHHIVHDLIWYTASPSESVARGAFGAVFYKELPRELLGYSINLSDLSKSARNELSKIHDIFKIKGKYSNDYVIDAWELLRIDLKEAGVSQGVQEEISQKVKDYYDLRFNKSNT